LAGRLRADAGFGGRGGPSHRDLARRRVGGRVVRTRAMGVGTVGVLMVAGLLLPSCANSNGLALARQACKEVSHSISLYEASTATKNPEQAAALRARALRELRLAVQPAAIAAGEAPEWSALGATLSESNRVPEANLIHALKAQCAVAESSNPLLGPIPTTPPSTSPPPTLPPPKGY
jgi:hypothetical protein